jgi:hypothetical protein
MNKKIFGPPHLFQPALSHLFSKNRNSITPTFMCAFGFSPFRAFDILCDVMVKTAADITFLLFLKFLKATQMQF